MFTDRIRFTVIKVNTNEILSRDLVVKEPEVMMNLSGPSRTTFKIDQGEQSASSYGIEWKTWGQWIIPEIETDLFGKICLGAQLVTHMQIDPESYDLIVDATGFMGYPKGLPWLENFNPIAVDPAEVVQRIWASVQNYPNANLGVQVQPSSTGTQLLPGYGYDGNELNFDFFAMFIREADFNDCGDQITQLARDLPLDMLEEVSWNADRTSVEKIVRLGYPNIGFRQDNLAFRLGENVINVEKADETEIGWASDVIIRSWMPGRVYSSRLSIADTNPAEYMSRVRRTVMEEAVNLNGIERANAWAKRKLTRRNVPLSFSKITVDPNHSNAPFGTWWLGDNIYIEAYGYPWYGDITGWHRVVSFTIKDGSPFIELGVKHQDAFDYDPIIYDPDVQGPAPDTENLLPNGHFTTSLAGWVARRGQWIRVATMGYQGGSSVRIDCDDDGEELESTKVIVTPGETLNLSVAVRYQKIIKNGTPAWTFGLGINKFINGQRAGNEIPVSILRDGVGPFTPLQVQYQVPDDVTEISMSLLVNGVTSGIAWWADARIVR